MLRRTTRFCWILLISATTLFAGALAPAFVSAAAPVVTAPAFTG
jgi:hypothetical protein